MEFFIALAVFVLFSGIMFWFVHAKFQGLQGKNEDSKLLSERLDRTTRDVSDMMGKVTDRIAERLDKVTDQVNARLTENVKAINESKSFLTERVENTERTVRSVTNKLAGLEEASQKMMELNKEILHFQQMLKVPKIRGGFGEVLLEGLLKDALPEEYVQMQYRLPSSGEIADAAIKLLDDNIVVIDAKFPLANFERVVSATDENEKTAHYKAFINDVKKHIKDIAQKYISPRDKTLDYAFMYIPMEAIYYEIVVKRAGATADIWEFSTKNKVIPVSPNSFLSYLHTLLIGFRGMKIEKQAKEIFEFIRQIRTDFKKFEDDFVTIGTHLNHAKNKFDDSSKRMDRLGSRLNQIDLHDAPVSVLENTGENSETNVGEGA